MALYRYGDSSSQAGTSMGARTTEFDVLKASHKFLRDDDETELSWEDQMAKKYYSSLFREFAVCDLKHYKSGNFALRWRTEAEVLSGSGEGTCGNTRCTHHILSKALPTPPLKTVELPFTYEEHGERKSALVKIVLCDRCLKKLMWKREKEKEILAVVAEPGDAKERQEASGIPVVEGGIRKESKRRRRDDRDRSSELSSRMRRNSRSLSPTSHQRKDGHRHRK